jgi:ribosomal RNA assembly protein
MEFIRIPEDRVSILIGEGGKTKRSIEKKTNCKLTINDGEVSIEGEGLDEWLAKDVIHAIGRGFSPEKAKFILQDDMVFESIDISDYANTKQAMNRLRGRIIGEKGRSRSFIEKNTGAMVSIYGKTASFIGPFEAVETAKKAVDMLCNGSRHGSVYRFLEKSRKQR